LSRAKTSLGKITPNELPIWVILSACMTNSKSYNINYNNSPPAPQVTELRSLALAALQEQNP
jgi:hypothetical protein